MGWEPLEHTEKQQNISVKLSALDELGCCTVKIKETTGYQACEESSNH